MTEKKTDPEEVGESIDQEELNQLSDAGDKTGTPVIKPLGQELAPGFDRVDRMTIFGLALILTSLMVAFFLFIRWQNLISFQFTATSQTSESITDYFMRALDYRERRLALILTYRTFLTGFGFTVGVVLSAIGGIFILRRATMQLDASGSFSSKPKAIEAATFSMALNSPGVFFMVGGVVVMVSTQMLALPVGAPEIFPTNSQPVCADDQVENGTCSVGGTNWLQIEHMCKSNPALEGCVALNELIQAVEN